MGDITRFILFIGPISSIFDYTTFFMMLYVFGCWDPARASLFQTGWFVESLHDPDAHHPRHPHEQDSLPPESRELAAYDDHVLIMAIAAWLPYSPLAPALGFTPLPRLYWPLLVATLLCYVVLTQAVKMWLIRKAWL